MDIKKLLNAKRVTVKYLDIDFKADFIKQFRQKHNLTQIALANILNVSIKQICKWEKDSQKIKGCSAILLTLLDKKPELLNELYLVKKLP